jgi:glucose-6-phosphate-specific signal transduction histidine kinase
VDVNITVDGKSQREILTLMICDDGVGGVDPALGTGVVGLVDRVEALGGQLQISSPAGAGTILRVTLPTDIDCERLGAASQMTGE